MSPCMRGTLCIVPYKRSEGIRLSPNPLSHRREVYVVEVLQGSNRRYNNPVTLPEDYAVLCPGKGLDASDKATTVRAGERTMFTHKSVWSIRRHRHE